eukprot:8667541-Heterocapsa_arctica.AAC.1
MVLPRPSAMRSPSSLLTIRKPIFGAALWVLPLLRPRLLLLLVLGPMASSLLLALGLPATLC